MEKIKPIITSWVESEKGKDILTVLIVILVGLGSFELGRLSGESYTSGIKIEYPKNDLEVSRQIESKDENVNLAGNLIQSAKIAPSPINSNSAGKAFFASSRGSKYYPVGCSAGKSLKQENRIYFTSAEEAQRAGYELSGSCK